MPALSIPAFSIPHDRQGSLQTGLGDKMLFIFHVYSRLVLSEHHYSYFYFACIEIFQLLARANKALS